MTPISQGEASAPATSSAASDAKDTKSATPSATSAAPNVQSTRKPAPAAGTPRAHRTLRAVLVTVGVLLAITLGLIYPALARGEAWRSAQWHSGWWLLGLLLVPVVVWRMTLGADRRMPRLTVSTIAPLLLGPRGFRTRLRDWPGILRGAALTLGILALARPQNVLRGESAEELGIDIVIVLDLSGSMKAVMDNPVPVARSQDRNRRQTRLDTAKEVIMDFIGRRKTDRIGVVVFGRAAYVLSPPTLDYPLLTTLVQKMDLDIIDGNGTAIGDALGTGVARLRQSNARSKAVILLTDGDSNAGAIAPEYASHLAQTQGVKVYTVQIGNGDEVDVQDGNDLFGQPHYVRAHFPVNPELLKKIASDTGGEAFVANDKVALERSMHAILDRLEKTRFEALSATMEDLFPFLLFPAVGLIALEALVRLFLVRRFP
ncbi:MAG TPA: VWA domain-containing protein [Polyangiaceae bacterium]|nr:VWA domain-containing protein [Polyangiaceae bacterium]